MPRKPDGADEISPVNHRRLIEIAEMRHATIWRAAEILRLNPKQPADREILLGILAKVFSEKAESESKVGRPKRLSLSFPPRDREVLIAAGDLYAAGMNIDKALNEAVKAAVKSGSLKTGNERPDKRRLKRKWDEMNRARVRNSDY